MLIKRLTLCTVFALGFAATTATRAETYTGSISYGDGLEGAVVWNTASLSWTVDDTSNPGLWTYQYSFVVDAKAIGHVITGASEDLNPASILEGSTEGCELGSFGHQGKSTPGIPRDLNGLKCTPEGKTLSYSWVIVTHFEPRWMNFYAKSGKGPSGWVYAYNTEFEAEPPQVGPADGNNGGWILGPWISHHERMIREFALGAFDRFREVMAPDDLTPRELRFVERHVQVDSEHWTYLLDAAGRQIFRPRESSTHLLPALESQLASVEEWVGTEVSDVTIERARALASQTLGANYGQDTETEVIPAREVITAKGPDLPTPRFHAGRTMVLFRPISEEEQTLRSYQSSVVHTPDGPRTTVQPVDLPPISNETAVSFAPGMQVPGTVGLESRPVRVDSTYLTPELAEITDLMWEGLKNNLFARVELVSDHLNFGSFFSANENRFEIAARSYEGEKFLQPTYFPPADPFYYEYCWDSLTAPTVEWLLNSDLYKKRVWDYWRTHGYKNGIRGNWLLASQTWEHNNIEVTLHKDLFSYDFLVEDRKIFKFIKTCDDDNELPYYLDDPPGNRLEEAFYQDLETLHIGLIYTHGGPLDSIATGRSTFSFLRNRDRWAVLREPGDPGLGHGNLRHLFLETCSSMNWNNTTHTKNLFSDWMTNDVADGIRTVGGFDGMLADGETMGWRYFSRYNAGDSLSDSWFFAGIDVSTCNVPIVAAYGSTEEEAATTLFDGRFSQSRAGTGWVIAAEVIPQRVTHEDRACCFASGGCSDVIFGACVALGGRPLDCGMTCEEHADDHCK